MCVQAARKTCSHFVLDRISMHGTVANNIFCREFTPYFQETGAGQVGFRLTIKMQMHLPESICQSKGLQKAENKKESPVSRHTPVVRILLTGTI